MVETKTKGVPFLEGTIINLCPPNTEHINLYTKWMNSPQIRKYARYEFPQNVEEVKKMFEPKQERVSSEIFFEIWHRDDEKPIGYTGLIRIRWFDRSAFLFYLIGEKDYWGKGHATEAARLVVEYGFNELNLHKINAGIFAPNQSSVRVVEKNDFKHELTLKKEIYIDGEHVDALKYSILRKEWQAIKSEE
ncbi:MAG: GNAT family N-acetyltransferase [Candidatus Lokiarchaeota archaeon]|nr:GNAT family N-acetyltransferase [Candidatus Lokiarchaeota archaeon]